MLIVLVDVLSTGNLQEVCDFLVIIDGVLLIITACGAFECRG